MVRASRLSSGLRQGSSTPIGAPPSSNEVMSVRPSTCHRPSALFRLTRYTTAGVADAAHVTTTFFYVAHRSLLQRDATLKIAQLHGKKDGSAQAIVGDGTPITPQAGAVSVVFARALARLLGVCPRISVSGSVHPGLTCRFACPDGAGF